MTMISNACLGPSAGTRYEPTCITSSPTPRLSQSAAWSCHSKGRASAGRGASAVLVALPPAPAGRSAEELEAINFP
jgi:hypothetical protein